MLVLCRPICVVCVTSYVLYRSVCVMLVCVRTYCICPCVLLSRPVLQLFSVTLLNCQSSLSYSSVVLRYWIVRHHFVTAQWCYVIELLGIAVLQFCGVTYWIVTHRCVTALVLRYWIVMHRCVTTLWRHVIELSICHASLCALPQPSGDSLVLFTSDV